MLKVPHQLLVSKRTAALSRPARRKAEEKSLWEKRAAGKTPMAGEQQPPECLLLQRRVHKARVPVLPHRSRLAHTRLSTMSAPVPKAEVLADPTEAETVRASEGGARSAPPRNAPPRAHRPRARRRSCRAARVRTRPPGGAAHSPLGDRGRLPRRHRRRGDRPRRRPHAPGAAGRDLHVGGARPPRHPGDDLPCVLPHAWRVCARVRTCAARPTLPPASPARRLLRAPSRAPRAARRAQRLWPTTRATCRRCSWLRWWRRAPRAPARRFPRRATAARAAAWPPGGWPAARARCSRRQ